MTVIITKLDETCFGCPSQWEGKTKDGRFVYIRFRWGWFTAGIGNSEDEAVGDTSLFAAQVSDGLDGVMSTGEMQRRLMEVGVQFE